ncbi:MAG: HEAT repeat domain-containing protein [Candidatus Micrarchaeota archaeon]
MGVPQAWPQHLKYTSSVKPTRGNPFLNEQFFQKRFPGLIESYLKKPTDSAIKKDPSLASKPPVQLSIFELVRKIGDSDDFSGASHACIELAKSKSSEAVEALLEAIKDDLNGWRRANSANALGKLWKDAEQKREIEESLIFALSDEEKFVRWSAADALTEIARAIEPKAFTKLDLEESENKEENQCIHQPLLEFKKRILPFARACMAQELDLFVYARFYHLGYEITRDERLPSCIA